MSPEKQNEHSHEDLIPLHEVERLIKEFGEEEKKLLNPKAKAIRDTFEIVYSEPHLVKEKLTEKQHIITSMLVDTQDYWIIAMPGSGKTSVILEASLKQNLKTIMVFPLAVQVKQNYSTFTAHYKNKIFGVYRGVSAGNIENHLEHASVLVSTYNSLEKICTVLGHRAKEFCLVIDEFHNLVIQHNFRSHAIRYVSEVLDSNIFKNVIRVTGTPEGILDRSRIHRSLSDSERDKTVLFSIMDPPPLVESYHIIRYRTDQLSKVTEHILGSSLEGKVVVLVDRIIKLQALKRRLVQKSNGTLADKSVAILHAKETRNATYRNIITEGEIPQDIQVLLTTSVICDGVNILNKNISSVYFLNIDNPLMIRQFLYRFRKSSPKCFDFTPHNAKRNFEKSDIDADINKMYESLVPIVNTANKMISDNPDLKGKALGKMFGTKDSNIYTVYYSKYANEYKIDRLGIRHVVLTEVHDRVMRDSEGRRLMLEYFEPLQIQEGLLESDNNFDFKTKKDIMADTLDLMGYKSTEIDPLRIRHGTVAKKFFRRLAYLYMDGKALDKLPEKIRQNLAKLDMEHEWQTMDAIKRFVETRIKQNNRIVNPSVMYKYVMDELPEIFQNRRLTQKSITALAKDIFVLADSNKRVTVGGLTIGNNWKVSRKMSKSLALSHIMQYV